MVLCLGTNRKDKDMSSECEGCNGYSGSYCKIGIIPYISYTEGCPCRNCLVKSMCITRCVNFAEYRIKSRGERLFSQVLEDFRKQNFSWYQYTNED